MGIGERLVDRGGPAGQPAVTLLLMPFQGAGGGIAVPVAGAVARSRGLVMQLPTVADRPDQPAGGIRAAAVGQHLQRIRDPLGRACIHPAGGDTRRSDRGSDDANANSAGPADRDFRFGRRGDAPVVVDWNRDGRTTVGVVRGGNRWLLRDANSAGAPNKIFSYGTCGGVFLSTQSARTTPGVLPALVGTEWTSLPTSEKVVVPTFDAGANADGVPSILSTLDAKGVPGTFFLTGRWLQAYAAYGRAIAARYPVGNHTDTHPDLTTLSNAEVRAEIADDILIRRKSGAEPRPWFRFPFGARDARTLGVVNCLTYGSVRWTVETLGWQGTSGGQSIDTVVQRVLDGLRCGAIVLMHVGSHFTDGSTRCPHHQRAAPTGLSTRHAGSVRLTSVSGLPPQRSRRTSKSTGVSHTACRARHGPTRRVR